MALLPKKIHNHHHRNTFGPPPASRQASYIFAEYSQSQTCSLQHSFLPFQFEATKKSRPVPPVSSRFEYSVWRSSEKIQKEIGRRGLGDIFAKAVQNICLHPENLLLRQHYPVLDRSALKIIFPGFQMRPCQTGVM